MALVFLARDEALGRDVVVKILMPDLSATLNIERFTREIRLVAKLQQANIVPVLAAGTAGALPFYSMPFIEGLTLRERIQQGPPPRLSEAVRILGDIGRALEYAHEHGVVHRDIKPENVLLSGGTAVVTDFGIAKAINAAKTQPRLHSLTGAGSTVGTPGYMSPEQAAGDHVDERSDLYAWGVVAYELIAGAHPFPGKKTAQQLIAAQIVEKPQPIDEIRPDVPAALASLIMRAMAKEPGDRPQSAREVVKALDDTASMRTLRGRRKFNALVSVALLIAALLVVAAIVFRGQIANWIGRFAGAGDVAPVISTLAVLPFEGITSLSQKEPCDHAE
jgi:serine/threonine protein kinase